MSDYISKSALIEALENECKGQLIGNENVTLISFGDVIDLVFEQPTTSETEIIRKPMERIKKRIDEKMESVDYWTKPFDKYEYYDNGFWEGMNEVATIVKEEGGIE